LALGIGAATAVFSLANHLLLRPLPGVDPAASLAQSYFAEWAERGYGPHPLSYPDVTDIRRGLSQVSALAGYTRGAVNVVLGSGTPRRLNAENVTASYFTALGLDVDPGRAFSDAEDDPVSGAAPVAVISHRLWRSAFGDADAVGRPVWINGVRLTVIGVAPPSFRGLDRVQETDLWLPGALTPLLNHNPDPGAYAARNSRVYYRFIIRLAPGATWDAAEAELNAAAAPLAELHGEAGESLRASRFEVFPGLGLPPLVRPLLAHKLRLLAIIVGLVLLIACSNVASLLLVSGLHRRSELAVRKALGAGAWRLTRQHLTEGGLLWLLGGAAGLLAAAAMVRLFEGTMNVWGDRFVPRVDLDYRVLAFVVVLSLGVGIVFAAVPAVSIARTSASRWLNEGPRTTRGRWRHARSGFTLVQLAASLTLVLGAMLFVRTLHTLNRAELGFDPGGVTLVGVSATDQGYGPDRLAAYYGELVEGLRARPEIEVVALGMRAPFRCCGDLAPVRAAGAIEDAQVLAGSNFVSGDYFRALDIPVLRGRVFAETTSLLSPDQSSDEVVVSRSLAERLFGDGEALGRNVVIFWEPDRPYRIIGVVGDARYDSFTDDPVTTLYYPSGVMLGRLQLILRAEDSRAALGPIVRAVASQVDPMLPPAEITPLSEIIDRARADARLFARLVGSLSLVALAISAVGLYGLVSFNVTARTQEFGVRMAIGAAPSSIRTMVLHRAVLVACAGVGLGAAGAWAGRRLIESRLAGVSPLDPLSWIVAVASLLAVAVAAALIPACRATRVDPVQTLRNV
jgi:predicted permease